MTAGESQLLCWNFCVSTFVPWSTHKKRASGPSHNERGRSRSCCIYHFSFLLCSSSSTSLFSQSARGLGTVNNRKPTTPVKRTVRTKTLLRLHTLACVVWGRETVKQHGRWFQVFISVVNFESLKRRRSRRGNLFRKSIKWPLRKSLEDDREVWVCLRTLPHRRTWMEQPPLLARAWTI